MKNETLIRVAADAADFKHIMGKPIENQKEEMQFTQQNALNELIAVQALGLLVSVS